MQFLKLSAILVTLIGLSLCGSSAAATQTVSWGPETPGSLLHTPHHAVPWINTHARRTEGGDLIITGQYTNMTGQAQVDPQILVMLRDAQGQTVAIIREGNLTPYLLPAEATGYFAVNAGAQPYSVALAEVIILFPTPAGTQGAQTDITLWSHYTPGYLYGAFSNTAALPLRNTRASVVLRDHNSRILWVMEVPGAPVDVLPGSEAVWTLPVPPGAHWVEELAWFDVHLVYEQ